MRRSDEIWLHSQRRPWPLRCRQIPLPWGRVPFVVILLSQGRGRRPLSVGRHAIRGAIRRWPRDSLRSDVFGRKDGAMAITCRFAAALLASVFLLRAAECAPATQGQDLWKQAKAALEKQAKLPCPVAAKIVRKQRTREFPERVRPQLPNALKNKLSQQPLSLSWAEADAVFKQLSELCATVPDKDAFIDGMPPRPPATVLLMPDGRCRITDKEETYAEVPVKEATLVTKGAFEEIIGVKLCSVASRTLAWNGRLLWMESVREKSRTTILWRTDSLPRGFHFVWHPSYQHEWSVYALAEAALCLRSSQMVLEHLEAEEAQTESVGQVKYLRVVGSVAKPKPTKLTCWLLVDGERMWLRRWLQSSENDILLSDLNLADFLDDYKVARRVAIRHLRWEHGRLSSESLYEKIAEDVHCVEDVDDRLFAPQLRAGHQILEYVPEPRSGSPWKERTPTTDAERQALLGQLTAPEDRPRKE